MAVVDWKNTGDVPIRAVFAAITPYTADGHRIPNGATDYCIYATSGPGIAPGETYVEPNDEGFVLIVAPGVFSAAARVDVRISRALER
jgi:hypothetical protein